MISQFFDGAKFSVFIRILKIVYKYYKTKRKIFITPVTNNKIPHTTDFVVCKLAITLTK